MAKKIGIVTSMVTSGHAIRGIGFYTKNLISELQNQAIKSDIEICEINESEAKTKNYSIIHYPFFDIFKHTLPFQKSTKTIVTVHDLIPLEFPKIYQPGAKGKYFFQLQKMSLLSVDRIITDSHYSLQSIKKHFGTPDEKLKLIPLAAGNNFRPIRSIKNLKSIAKKYALPQKFVLYVGDINYTKNINLLLSACIKLNVPVCLVGKSLEQLDQVDTSHPELKHISQTKVLVKNQLVHILGFVSNDDIVHVYNTATIYCQPSIAEGFGLSPLESMSCGVATITSDASALVELVGPKMIESTFSLQNSEGLINLLQTFWNDSPKRKNIAQLGYERSKDFSWSKTASDTINVYKELL